MNRIEPTVGRMVWFQPGMHDPLQKFVPVGVPLSGQIACVLDSGRVNLCVLDQMGVPHSRLNIELEQDPEVIKNRLGERSWPESFCRWMPYQLGQAERTKAAEAKPWPQGRASLVTEEMVNRFLAWPLPDDFSPDCGISFDGRKPDQHNPHGKGWPVGTNLLTAVQARQMLEYVLGG